MADSARERRNNQDESTGERTWYVYDGLGSVLAQVDEDGNVTACRYYDVYGSERWSDGSSETDHAFVGGLGQTTEDPTGLICMGTWYYDPELQWPGAWIRRAIRSQGGDSEIATQFSDATGPHPSNPAKILCEARGICGTK